VAARSVLERAVESGSALALFLLAETYDGMILSEWGISGRRGSVTKARELYAKAAAGGVHEAEYRLSSLL
jgi:TPR repeat protein